MLKIKFSGGWGSQNPTTFRATQTPVCPRPRPVDGIASATDLVKTSNSSVSLNYSVKSSTVTDAIVATPTPLENLLHRLHQLQTNLVYFLKVMVISELSKSKT